MLCVRTRLVLFLLLSTALLPAQIANRDALVQGIGRARANPGINSSSQDADRNAAIFHAFARLQNSLAAKDQAAVATELQRILTAADALAMKPLSVSFTPSWPIHFRVLKYRRFDPRT